MNSNSLVVPLVKRAPAWQQAAPLSFLRRLGLDGLLGPVACGLLLVSTLFQASAAPANDNFASREVLVGFTNVVTTSNAGATKESGEPDHHGIAGGVSVWWSWTAPTNALVTVDTIGSSLDSVLAVYTGLALNNLTLVGSDDDSGGNGTSQLSFTGVAGTTYQFAVDGFGGFPGDITFRLVQTPPMPPLPPWLVTTTADNGPGSLRQAIIYANTNAGVDTIAFAISGAGPRTITLAAPLPEITEPVVVDGTTQPGYVGVPQVIIYGNY